MTGQDYVDLYYDLFGEEPFRLTTVSIDDERYMNMIGYCNLTGQKISQEIIEKFFTNNYDKIAGKPNFKSFKKQNGKDK